MRYHKTTHDKPGSLADVYVVDFFAVCTQLHAAAYLYNAEITVGAVSELIGLSLLTRFLSLRQCAIPYLYSNSSPQVIRLAVAMYIRYPLSLRQVEDLLFERSIDICHETV